MLPVDASLGPRPEPLTSFFVPETELVLPAALLGQVHLIRNNVTHTAHTHTARARAHTHTHTHTHTHC
jgi:hypothetical protein